MEVLDAMVATADEEVTILAYGVVSLLMSNEDYNEEVRGLLDELRALASEDPSLVARCKAVLEQQDVLAQAVDDLAGKLQHVM